MGPIGAQEMIFIVLLALLLFGPKKLPELGRMLGKGLTEFRRAKNELKTTFESHMQELERETKISEQPKASDPVYSPPTSYSSASYLYPYDEDGQQSSAYRHSAEPYGAPAVAEASPANGSSNGAHNSEPDRSLPVSGTVPRSKFTGTIEPVPAAKEDHSA